MKIAKDYKEPHTEAMRYGTELHAVAEDFIRDGTPIPDKFAFLNGPGKHLDVDRVTSLQRCVWV